MSNFANKNKTFAYRHPDWDEKSAWHFRAERCARDDDAISEMTTRTIVGKIDQQEMRAALRKGQEDELFARAVSQETIMSAEIALLVQMTAKAGWEGPDFTIPDDFTDDNDQPHPLAGQLAPVTAEWVGLRDASERRSILKNLNQVWAGAPRSSEDIHRFHGSDGGVGRHADGQPDRPKASK